MFRSINVPHHEECIDRMLHTPIHPLQIADRHVLALVRDLSELRNLQERASSLFFHSSLPSVSDLC